MQSQLNSEAAPTPEEARKLIDQDLEKYLAPVLALKSQRNRLAPIARLPVEIMSRIFFYVKIAEADIRYNRNLGLITHNELEWIKISHVSSHWRDMSLNSPALWAKPPLGNLRWVVEMLKRSKTADLSIETRIHQYPYVLVGLKKTLRLGSRIKHLSITGLPTENDDILKHLPISAPQLQSLRISGDSFHLPYTPTVTYDLDGRSEMISIPSGVLTSIPHLRLLELSRCKVDWSSHLFNHITHLKLHDIAKSTRRTFIQFMNILEKMPEIEFLDLQNAVPTQTLNRVLYSSRIHLPRLKYLDLFSTTAEVNAFFCCIAFPPNATVHVTAVASHSDHVISDFSAILSSIDGSYSSVHDLTIRTLAMDQPGSCRNYIRLSLFLDAIEDKPFPMYIYDPKVGHFSLTLQTREICENLQGSKEILSNLLSRGHPLEKVSHVHLCDTRIEPETLARTIGMLPAVGFVRAGGPMDSKSLLDALHLHNDVVDAESGPLFFAHLTSIWIADARFDREGGWPIPTPRMDIEQMLDCLIQRYECGYEIEKMSLSDCDIQDQDIIKLQDIVVDVDWYAD